MNSSKRLRVVVFAAILSLFCPKNGLFGQSPNASGAVSRIEVANLQPRSEKNQNSGYAGLNSSGLVAPENLFPSFAGAAAGTIWIKSGSSFAPLSGVAFSGSGVTTNNVLLGLVDTGIYGVKIASGSTPLFLRGGSGNRVMVDYNNTIGGSNMARNAYIWYIDPSGGFKLAGGEFNGDIDFNGADLTELLTAGGTALSINFSSPAITSSSGNIVMTAPSGSGVVVPSTASSGNTTFALNVVSANSLYGRKDTTNTWTQIQTFSSAPVVPDGSFSVAKTTSLQAALDLALKRDGSNAATGNVNLGGFKIINLGTPTLSGDAVSLGYLSSNYETDPVTSLAAASGTPLTFSSSTGDVVITLAKATTVVDGYLSAADWATFNGKQTALSANLPLSISGSTLSMTQVSDIANGWLSSADYIRLGNPSGISNAKVSSILASKTTPADVTTTSQTSVHSYTTPANSLAAGDVIVMKTAGKFILEGAQTISVVFALGGSTVHTFSLPGVGFTPSTSEVPYELEITIVIRTTGASGTASCFATISTPTYKGLLGPNAISIDTTATRLLNVLATISAISGTNHFSAEIGTVRIN